MSRRWMEAGMSKAEEWLASMELRNTEYYEPLTVEALDLAREAVGLLRRWYGDETPPFNRPTTVVVVSAELLEDTQRFLDGEGGE